jgi:hypothetical protein
MIGEEVAVAYFKILFRYLPGATKETNKNERKTFEG